MKNNKNPLIEETETPQEKRPAASAKGFGEPRETSANEVIEALPEKPEAQAEPRQSPEELKNLRETVEAQELDDSLKLQATKQASQMQSLGEQEKIQQLLDIAKKKGVAYAVHVAKKMDSPYLLDMLHDKLAQEGLFKNFKI